jgi:hypothetical protein
MVDNTLEYIKVGIPKSLIRGLKSIHAELENKSFALTVRDVLNKGFENYETAFLIKDIVLSELIEMKNTVKEQNKIIKEQSNRIAQLEIKTLKEVSVISAVLKEYIEFGPLTKDEVERIEKASQRALFESLNSNKKDKKDELE